jgi:hypothetical protein
MHQKTELWMVLPRMLNELHSESALWAVHEELQ